MLEKGLRYDFIAKHSRNCTTEQLLENHFHYFLKYQEGDFHEPVESFSDCLWYIKKFVGHDKPQKVVRLLLDYTDYTVRNKVDVMLLYIDLMSLVTRIQVFAHMYDDAVYWARKTMDMIEHFYPSNKMLSKEYFYDLNGLYEDCLEIYQKYKKYFDAEQYKEFIFEWERKLYAPATHANQNFKYRIHI